MLFWKLLPFTYKLKALVVFHSNLITMGLQVSQKSIRFDRLPEILFLQFINLDSLKVPRRPTIYTFAKCYVNDI